MNGITHLTTGLILGLIATKGLTVNEIGEQSSRTLFLLGSVLGSLAPDVDHPKSIISKGIGGIHSKLTRNILIHRGPTHSITVCAIISVILSTVEPFVGVGIFIGWLSHLFLDMLTPSGIPLFWPYKNNKYSFFPTLTSTIYKTIKKNSIMSNNRKNIFRIFSYSIFKSFWRPKYNNKRKRKRFF